MAVVVESRLARRNVIKISSYVLLTCVCCWPSERRGGRAARIPSHTATHHHRVSRSRALCLRCNHLQPGRNCRSPFFPSQPSNAYVCVRREKKNAKKKAKEMRTKQTTRPGRMERQKRERARARNTGKGEGEKVKESADKTRMEKNVRNTYIYTHFRKRRTCVVSRLIQSVPPSRVV